MFPFLLLAATSDYVMGSQAAYGIAFDTEIGFSRAVRDYDAVADHQRPLFEALDRAGLQGKDVAAVVGVAPSTFSKWRNGKAKFPPRTQIFLTLFLANWLVEVDAHRTAAPLDDPSAPQLRAIGWLLRAQESFNAQVPVDVVRQGSRQFRSWYAQTKRRIGKNGKRRIGER